MNTLHVLYSFPLRVGRSGIGETAWQQVAGLSRLGAQVTLCCGSLERPIPGLHRLVETMRVGALPIPYRLLGDDRAFRFHDWRVSKIITRRPYDVLHAWPGGSLWTLKVARKLGIRTFLERPNAHTAFAYEEVAREHQSIGLSVPKSHTHAFNGRRLVHEEAEYALADRLLCPSDFVARSFIERGFALERIARHQYGYSEDRIQANGSSRDRSRFTVIFVGRCEPRKGLHYALQAWHQSGAAATGRFIICGEFVQGYRELLAPLLCHSSITEMGFVTDVAPLMRSADALVLSSIEEGSALVTYEARGAGCVVLASDAAGAVGNHGVDILIHPARDIHTLAQQLRSLSQERSTLETLRTRSINAVDRLNWTHAAQTLLAKYRETVIPSGHSHEASI